jgi:hypothetical protein
MQLASYMEKKNFTMYIQPWTFMAYYCFTNMKQNLKLPKIPTKWGPLDS